MNWFTQKKQEPRKLLVEGLDDPGMSTGIKIKLIEENPTHKKRFKVV